MSAQTAVVVKGGAKPQQIVNGQSLGANAGALTPYQVISDTDVIGFVITLVLTTTHGTGTYAGAASVLSSITELQVLSQDKTTLHDFKTPNVDIPRLSFMFSDQYRRGGYYTADTAISADGTYTQSTNFYAPLKQTEFPIQVAVSLAALGAIYSTVGTGTAVLTVTITPIRVPSIGSVMTDYSVLFTLVGLTAINNDVTFQMVERQRVMMFAGAFTAEAHLTDITYQSPTLDILALQEQNLVNYDRDTLSGHQTNFLRVKLNGVLTVMSKNGMTIKLNEVTSDNPVVYVIGHLR